MAGRGGDRQGQVARAGIDIAQIDRAQIEFALGVLQEHQIGRHAAGVGRVVVDRTDGDCHAIAVDGLNRCIGQRFDFACGQGPGIDAGVINQTIEVVIGAAIAMRADNRIGTIGVADTGGRNLGDDRHAIDINRMRVVDVVEHIGDVMPACSGHELTTGNVGPAATVIEVCPNATAAVRVIEA